MTAREISFGKKFKECIKDRSAVKDGQFFKCMKYGVQCKSSVCRAERGIRVGKVERTTIQPN
jgi:hypothetical protein